MHYLWVFKRDNCLRIVEKKEVRQEDGKSVIIYNYISENDKQPERYMYEKDFESMFEKLVYPY